MNRTKLPRLTAKQQSPSKAKRAALNREEKLPRIAPPGVRMSNPDLRLIIYKTLEEKRGAKIGVPPLKNFNVTRSDSEEVRGFTELPVSQCVTPMAPTLEPLQTGPAMIGLTRGNTLAPFTTLTQKPTCGYYFTRETANNKVRIGIPPSDLVKWRADYNLGMKQA